MRSFLVAPPLLAALSGVGRGDDTGRPMLLICDGLDAGTDPQALRTFVQAFGAQRVKLALVFGGAAAETIPLAASTQGDADFIEWVIDCPSVLDDLPYFQMRQASVAQEVYSGFRPHWGDCLTLSCREPGGDTPALVGIRAAGFRNVLLRPETDRQVECWTTENGILHLVGGRRTELSHIEPIFAAIREPGGLADPLVIYLSLDRLAGYSAETLTTIAGTLADGIATAMYDGIIRPMVPSEFHLAGFGAARLLALHFELDGVAGAALPLLLQRLVAIGLPFSFSGAAIDPSAMPVVHGVTPCTQFPASPTAAAWHSLRSVLTGALNGTAEFSAPQACIVSRSQSPDLLRSIAETGATAVITGFAGAPDTVGLDDRGLLHIPAAVSLNADDTDSKMPAVAKTLTHGGGRLRDALVVIQLQAAAAGTQAFEEWLPKLLVDQEPPAAGLAGLARGIMPPDPIFDLLKRSTVEDFVDGTGSATISDDERERLLADARLAWRYFSRLSDRRTGLAYSAAQSDGQNLILYPLVTMWEIGSQILATISAHRIGIIDRSTFSSRIARLLQSVPASTVGGMSLPQSEVSASGTQQAVNSFSASDTGRLLTALKILEQDFGMERAVAQIVDRWDLAKVTANRHLHNVSGGQLKEYSNSNYVDYAVRGFGRFGFSAASPYEIETDETGIDRDMRLLSRVAGLGPIGTEPHVLEELEVGYSEASRLIARLLFTAQLGAYQSTGQLFCVSETALERDPWFTYHGYRLGANKVSWPVETMVESAEYPTEESRAAFRVLNTKGAYAWAAVRPHAYSQQLLAVVRARARIPDLGFAAGLYMETGKPTQNFSDTNTNAVILESIAYMLGARHPLSAKS